MCVYDDAEARIMRKTGVEFLSSGPAPKRRNCLDRGRTCSSKALCLENLWADLRVGGMMGRSKGSAVGDDEGQAGKHATATGVNTDTCFPLRHPRQCSLNPATNSAPKASLNILPTSNCSPAASSNCTTMQSWYATSTALMEAGNN